jgi:sulfate transport system ATP-binding protein
MVWGFHWQWCRNTFDRQIRKLGPAVRVTLAIEGNKELVEAELTRDVFQNLGQQEGEEVYVRPRQVRVFVEDYQI